MRILVTGPTGYLGSDLIRYLRKNGHKVYGLTRELKNSQDFEIFETDYSIESLRDVFNIIGNLDAVIHIAASLKYFEEATKIFESNYVYTKNLFEVTVESNIKKFIYASSVEATKPRYFFNILNLIFRPCQLTNYGKSKYAAESYISNNSKNTKYIILRIGSIFSGDRYTFITQIFESVIDKTRFFYQLPYIKNYHILPVHISDVIYAINLSLKSDKSGAYNVHYPSVTIEKIVNIVVKFTGIKNFIMPAYKFKHLSYMYLFHQLNRMRRGYGDFTSYLLAEGFILRRMRSKENNFSDIDGFGDDQCNLKIIEVLRENINNNVLFFDK